MIFEVTPEHIEVLSDADLRTLVGYLIVTNVLSGRGEGPEELQGAIASLHSLRNLCTVGHRREFANL